MSGRTRYALLFGLALTLATGIASSQKPSPCGEKVGQRNINDCFGEQYKKADAELYGVYQELLTKYAASKKFSEKLKIAEEAWIRFRDAHLESLYTEDDQCRFYGSVYPMCRAIELTRLTVERTEELKRMLQPREGDVCAFEP